MYTRHALEGLVLVDDLNAMLVGLGRRILPYGSKVAVHDDGRRRMFDVAGTSTAVDGEGRHCISGVPAEWLKRIFGCRGDVLLMSRKASSPLDVGGSLKRERWQVLPVVHMTIVCMTLIAGGTPLPAPTKMDILGHVPAND